MSRGIGFVLAKESQEQGSEHERSVPVGFHGRQQNRSEATVYEATTKTTMTDALRIRKGSADAIGVIGSAGHSLTLARGQIQSAAGADALHSSAPVPAARWI